MPSRERYAGPERRRFRRIELRCPVRIELRPDSKSGEMAAVEGVTENLSFGGALVGVSDASGLRGATPVTVHFIDQQSAVPALLTGVVWRRSGETEPNRVAVEFDAPLLAYEGAVEIADRLQWLRDMGGEEFMRRNVERFIDSVPEMTRLARDAGEAGDLEAIALAGRSIKASAGNVGAVNLYEVARRAEQAANEGDRAVAVRFVEMLAPYYEAARAELERER
jgi:HPt (histidine-containing phosphotransfer) domain-containing protein